MSKDKDWRPRLSIEIPEDIYYKKAKLIPWGQETRIINILLKDLLDLLEDSSTRNKILANIVRGNITVEHILRAGGGIGSKNNKE